jgi:hypothetical protein
VRLRALQAAAVALIAIGGSAEAQTSELWPELDVYWQPAEHQRTFLEISASAEQEGSKRQDTGGLYQDYLFLPNGYVRGGYRYTFSTHDASYRESRLVGEWVERVFSHGMARLVNRARFEMRWVNGDPSYRIRERIHLQRVPPNPRWPALAPYGTFEVYYDSRLGAISRLAGRVGTEARLFGPASIDVYVARQDNLRESPSYVNALGVTIKLVY